MKHKKHLDTKKDKMGHLFSKELKIILGTQSETKMQYLKDGIVSVNASSGVLDQPIGDDVILQGARNRVKEAFHRLTDQDKIGIGLEDGLVMKDDGLYSMLCIASIYDGQKYAGGFSKLRRLPKQVSFEIENRAQYGEVIRLCKPDNDEIKAVDELISRRRSFMEAIDSALDKFTRF